MINLCCLCGRFVGVGARRVRSLFQAAKKKVRSLDSIQWQNFSMQDLSTFLSKCKTILLVSIGWASNVDRIVKETELICLHVTT